MTVTTAPTITEDDGMNMDRMEIMEARISQFAFFWHMPPPGWLAASCRAMRARAACMCLCVQY